MTRLWKTSMASRKSSRQPKQPQLPQPLAPTPGVLVCGSCWQMGGGKVYGKSSFLQGGHVAGLRTGDNGEQVPCPSQEGWKQLLLGSYDWNRITEAPVILDTIFSTQAPERYARHHWRCSAVTPAILLGHKPSRDYPTGTTGDAVQ